MEGAAELGIGAIGEGRFQLGMQGQEFLFGEEEAILAWGEGFGLKATALVEGWEHADSDAGILGGLDEGQAEGGEILVGDAVAVAMNVMKFADPGVAGFEHLSVEAEGNGVHRFGRYAIDEIVHERSPGPKAIARGGRIFAETGEGMLKGVAMHVGHAWEGEGIVPRDERVSRGVGLNLDEMAVGADGETNVGLESIGEQG